MIYPNSKISHARAPLTRHSLATHSLPLQVSPLGDSYRPDRNRYNFDSTSPGVAHIYTDNTAMKFVSSGLGSSGYQPVQLYCRSRPHLVVRIRDLQTGEDISEAYSWHVTVTRLDVEEGGGGGGGGTGGAGGRGGGGSSSRSHGGSARAAQGSPWRKEKLKTPWQVAQEAVAHLSWCEALVFDGDLGGGLLRADRLHLQPGATYRVSLKVRRLTCHNTVAWFADGSAR